MLAEPKVMDVVMVEIGRIVPAAYNPPNRTTSKSTEELKSSIQRVGLLYPLLVNEDYTLIDGHRRLSCLQELGHEYAPVMVVSDPDRVMFVEANFPAMKLSTRDDLYVYLSGGPVSERARKSIEAMAQWLSREDLEYAAENRISHKGFNWIFRLVRAYLNRSMEVSDEFMRKFGRYLIYSKQSFAVRRALASGMSAELIVSAVENNTPLV